MDVVFTTAVRVTGQLSSWYEFTSPEAAAAWIEGDTYASIRQNYSLIQHEIHALDHLRIGDSCTVVGEGAEQFTIVGIRRYEADRYGFMLNKGTIEEVYKCKRIDQGQQNKDIDIRIDFWKPSGKWYSGGTVRISGNHKLWSTELKRELVANQKLVTPSTFLGMVVTISDLQYTDDDPTYTHFFHHMFPMGSFNENILEDVPT